MNKYLIQGHNFNDVQTFFISNFNPIDDIVAIADYPSGAVVCTDEESIIQLFRENNFILNTIHDNVFLEMFIDNRPKGIMIGNREALHHLTHLNF